MNIIYLSGSPRKRSNTDYLLHQMLHQTGGKLMKLTDYAIEPCRSCWKCRKKGVCAINDDMKTFIIPKIVAADALVIGSPVYFNNVSAQLKSFIDRTWSIKQKLRNKIGATVVVGRRYGAEGAIMAINAFFLKHEMLIANRGVSGIAFRSGEIKGDSESIEAGSKLAKRVLELGAAFDAFKRGNT
jgi:multimeric flavodoxin WrbA